MSKNNGKTMGTSMSIRTQLFLLTVITSGLFIIAIAGAIWHMRTGQERMLGFIDGELTLERDLTTAYAQGLQMGQALRNILLDPENPKAYENFNRAEAGFNEIIGRIAASASLLKGGAETLGRLEAATQQWSPLRSKVIETVRTGDPVGARMVLVNDETPAWRLVRGMLLEQIGHLSAQSSAVKSEVVAKAERASAMSAALAVAALLACVLASFFVVRHVIGQLGGEPGYAAEVARRIAAGDLSGRVQLRSGDDNSLLAAMQSMQGSLCALITEIRRHADSLAGAIDALRDNEARVADASRQQSDAGNAIAAAVEEMTVSISQVSEHADDADRLTEHAVQQVQSSIAVIDNATKTISRISERMSASAEVMTDLGSSAEGISDVVKVIQDVAEQTNLLALNAAIEAARAGEQGRGFAVVADEVRKLAERTSQSTHEITSMIQRVQTSAKQAVRSMEEGRDLAGQGAVGADQAIAEVTTLEDGSRKVRQAVASINAALREQRAASTDIAQSIEQIAQMSEHNHAATSDSLQRADALQALAGALEATVQRFRLS